MADRIIVVGSLNPEKEVQDRARVLSGGVFAKGYIECEIGGVADFSYPTSKLRRGRVQGGGHVCPTLTSQSMGVCRIEKVVRGAGRYAA